MPEVKNRIGEKYSRLTVLKRATNTAGGGIQWQCKCDCGNITVVRSGNLTSGNTTSCGCRHREICTIDKVTHGLSKTATYGIWNGMMMRCYNPNRKLYHHYGGRGIKVCKRWHTFANFFADMGLRPGRLTVERKNGLGHYEPDNCVWASRKTQAVNRCTSVFITYQGLRMCRKDWEEYLGLTRGVLYARLKAGWPLERAMTEESKPGARKKLIP